MCRIGGIDVLKSPGGRNGDDRSLLARIVTLQLRYVHSVWRGSRCGRQDSFFRENEVSAKAGQLQLQPACQGADSLRLARVLGQISLQQAGTEFKALQ
jgi:hypothetical protein